MSSGTWFSFALLLLQVALRVFTWMEKQQMLDEARREVLDEQKRQLEAFGKRAQDIRNRVDELSPDELDSRLRSDFRDAAARK